MSGLIKKKVMISNTKALAYVWKGDDSGKRGNFVLNALDGVQFRVCSEVVTVNSDFIYSNSGASSIVTVQDGDRMVVELEWHIVSNASNSGSFEYGINSADGYGNAYLRCVNGTLDLCHIYTRCQRQQ